MKTGIKRSIYLVAIAHQGLIHRARRETSTLRQRYYLSKVVPFQRRSFLKFYSFFFLLSGGKRKASAKSKTSARLDAQKDTSRSHSYAAAARPWRACLRPPEKRRKQNHACPADQKADEFRNKKIFFKIAMHPNLTQRQCFSVQNALLFIFFMRMPRDVSSIPAASFKIYPAPEF